MLLQGEIQLEHLHMFITNDDERVRENGTVGLFRKVPREYACQHNVAAVQLAEKLQSPHLTPLDQK